MNGKLFRWIEQNPNKFFLISVLIIYVLSGIIFALPQRPRGLHLWGQTDRASVARNFYYEDLNILKPRINNVYNGTGITGLEFPAINWMAAVFYRVFGFHEFWYRFLMALLIGSGLWAGFRIWNEAMNKPLQSALWVFLWFLTPVLVYYTPNFFSDAGSLGLMMCAWFAFFKLKQRFQWNWVFLLFLSGSLAALVKVTSAISLITMLGLMTLVLLGWILPRSTFPLRSMIAVLVMMPLCLGITLIWYQYSGYLNEHYYARFFLSKPKLFQSLGEFFQVTQVVWSHWWMDFLNFPLYIFLVAGSIAMIRYRKIVNRMHFIITALLFTGCGCFYFLLGKQFLWHNYYFIPLTPVIFFFLLTLRPVLIKLFSSRVMVVILSVSVGVALVQSTVIHKDLYHGKETVYGEIGQKMDALGIPRKEKVFVGYEHSVNVPLYFIDRKGVTFWKDIKEFRVLAQNMSGYFYGILTPDVNFRYPLSRNHLDTLAVVKDHAIVHFDVDNRIRKAFFDTLYRYLEKPVMKIENNSKWYRNVKRKARLQNIPLKWAVVLEGISLYNQNRSRLIKRYKQETGKSSITGKQELVRWMSNKKNIPEGNKIYINLDLDNFLSDLELETRG